MSFLEEYKQKLVSADEAVKIVKSGDWVDYGWCTGTPDALDKALARRTDELKDVNVRGGILLKPLAIFEREDAGEHFTWNSWHMGGYERRLIKRGCSFYSPIRYSELPRYYRDSNLFGSKGRACHPGRPFHRCRPAGNAGAPQGRLCGHGGQHDWRQ